MSCLVYFFTRRRGFPEYCTVFADFNKRKLFEVAQTKSKKYLMEQLKHIPGRENVKIVCIDLAPGYRSFINEFFPNAKIVADKFHVLKLLMNEIMRERQSIEDHHKKDLHQRRAKNTLSVQRIKEGLPKLPKTYKET